MTLLSDSRVDRAAEPLIRHLSQYSALAADDIETLERIAGERVRRIGVREDIVSEGDKPGYMRVILSGWACRYKALEDGRRQIVAFFLPGDVCDFNVFLLARQDHSIGALTPTKVTEISREAFDNILANHPRLTKALWKDSLVTVAIQREWTLNLGQRVAFERMAHLFCELFIRLEAVGQVQGNSCHFPVTQADLADATGLSTVHVNRTLQELRAANLIILSGKTLTIPDMEALRAAALFDANYLHLGEEGRNWMPG